MARAYCLHCEARISVGDSFCTRCGNPTLWASHDERIEWEVAQWRAKAPTRAPVHTPAFAGPRPARPAPAPPPPAVQFASAPPLPDGPLRVPRPAVPPRPVRAKTIDLTPPPSPVAATNHAPTTTEDTTPVLGEIVALLREVNDRLERLGARVDAIGSRRRFPFLR